MLQRSNLLGKETYLYIHNIATLKLLQILGALTLAYSKVVGRTLSLHKLLTRLC